MEVREFKDRLASKRLRHVTVVNENQVSSMYEDVKAELGFL